MNHKTWFLFNTSEQKTFKFISRKLARQYKKNNTEYKLFGPITLSELYKRLPTMEQKTINHLVNLMVFS